MAGDRQRQVKELTRLASLMRGCEVQSEVFAVYLERIEAVEAGASALAREQEILELVTDTYAEDYRRIVDRIRVILETPR